jgi:hypothetical protein
MELQVLIRYETWRSHSRSGVGDVQNYPVLLLGMKEYLFKLYEEIVFVLNNVEMFALLFDLFNKVFSSKYRGGVVKTQS